VQNAGWAQAGNWLQVIDSVGIKIIFGFCDCKGRFNRAAENAGKNRILFVPPGEATVR